MSAYAKEFGQLSGFRVGAHFCKMDLHTHSPASECSSFTLPKSVMKILEPAQGTKQNTKAAFDHYYDLVETLALGKRDARVQQLDQACTDELGKRVHVGPVPKLERDSLRDIAHAWFTDVQQAGLDNETLHDHDRKIGNAERKERHQKYLSRALFDIERYLMSLFFPQQYVMRCYIEGLQIVALTDHNHPGYIVPRIQRLGTWYQKLCDVNEHYIAALRAKQSPGNEIRAAIDERLQLAVQQLTPTRHADAETAMDSENKGSHGEPQSKQLSKSEKRLAWIRDLRKEWQNGKRMPKPLYLLPGTEITASNVHILAVFPPKWEVPLRIAKILGDVDIPEEHWGRGYYAAAAASVQDVITRVRAEGGIAIPAHSNSDFKGILRLFEKGLALQKVLDHPGLLALETIGGSVLKGKPAWETLATLDKDRDGDCHWCKRLCFTKGSDAHECRIERDGTGEDMGMRYTNIKMDVRLNDTPDEVFGALRLALQCGVNRIIECPTEDGYNYRAKSKKEQKVPRKKREALLTCDEQRRTIIGLTVSGKNSFADGMCIRFNPYLTCAIGPGKSTILRMLGYAFGVCGFLESTKSAWLPQQVRVYWRKGDEYHCLERTGRSVDPNAESVQVRHLIQKSDGQWEVAEEMSGDESGAFADFISMWPQPGSKANGKFGSNSVETLLKDLLKELDAGDENRPLLVNQPREIFNSEEHVEDVLSRPLLKQRQIIWATASANVPTGLDAEKIIVCQARNDKHMQVQCAGDLHEDEIRDALLSQFEGGSAAFLTRVKSYLGDAAAG